jgi:hypothetical protein
VASLRSAAPINTLGGPSIPPQWEAVHKEMHSILHDENMSHIRQYVSTLEHLPDGLESCRLLVSDLETKQKRLTNGSITDESVQQSKV